MDRKIRVGAVSYLNTKPLLYGIQKSEIIRDIELTIEYPSRIAAMLLRDEIDLGLVPVAVIPQMHEYYINGDYCIGSNGSCSLGMSVQRSSAGKDRKGPTGLSEPDIGATGPGTFERTLEDRS